MNYELDYFLKLAKCAIYNQEIASFTPPDVNWKAVLKLARQHNMSAILYKVVSTLPTNLGPEQELLQYWKEEAFLHGIQQLAQNHEEGLILDKAKEQGILCLPFKGLLLADLYPEPLMRVSGDADILVAPEDKDKMIEILVKQGFIYNEKETIDTVFVYEKPGILTVELHISLWEEYIGERKARLERLNITDSKTLIEVNACNSRFHTLGYNEHLIYQIYHIIKHFSLSGIGIRHLTDLTLYVNNFFEKIDFNRFWDVMSQLNYSVCCSCFFKICIECLGMREDAIKHCKIQSDIDIKPFVEDMITGGVFGNATQERYHARNIIKPYLDNEKKVELKKYKLVLGILFPGVKVLKSQYSYAKKHSVLIPIAWIHRNCYLLQRHLGKSRTYYGDKTINQAKYRLQLLKELEIIND